MQRNTEKPCISPKYLRQELEQLALDQRQWNEEPTTKNNLGVDAVSRQEVLDLIADYDLSMGQVVRGIHALPSVTPQEPCDKCEVTFKDDNAVSRLSVRDIIYVNAYELEYPDGSSEYVVNRDELIKYLMELSPVYPKSDKPSGKWIKVHPLQENDEGDYMCSECKCGGLVWKPTTYCPNCGCRMVEPQESEG